MKRALLHFTTAMLAISLAGCNNQPTSDPQTQRVDSTVKQTTNDMKSFVSIFEIPATDLSRAVDFYQAIFSIEIEKMDMPGMQMGIWPYEGQMVVGVIVQGEGFQPSADGVTIYLNGGDDLQIVLDKVEKHGGKVMVGKTPHADESGYFAMFLDSEGNRLGLHSPN
ncbi:MAG: VOC family protein [Imperialibacter sp.]|uniref:VOC family protein n=1 Tax=Imperialibacter sp. TaxID=2038411 RepID=UPI003A882A4C